MPWSKGVKAAVVVRLIAWMVFFALVSGLTKSFFEYVNSVIDWLVVGGVSAAFACLLALFVGPIYLLIKRP